MSDERRPRQLVGELAPRPGAAATEDGASTDEPDAPLPDALDPDLASWTADYPWVFPLVDPWVEALWHERRWRRRAVKAAGAIALLGAVAGLVDLCERPPALEAITCWATFGASTGVAGRDCPVAVPAADP